MAQLSASIQQRVRHGYRRQRPAPLPSRAAKSAHQSQLGIAGPDVAHARSVSGCLRRHTSLVVIAHLFARRRQEPDKSRTSPAITLVCQRHDREILDSGAGLTGSTGRFQKGESAVITEPAKTFARMFRGYDPAAVDAYIEKFITKQQLLLDEVESLRARLKESGDEAAALRIEVTVLTDEVAVLTDTSPSPQAMQHRMAKMLRRAVDEVSEMQAEAQAEADALIEAAEAKNEAAQRKYKELLADIAAQRKALDAEYEETTKKQDAELATMRAETQAAIDKAWHNAQQEREQLLADAKQGAEQYREQTRRALDEASQQRIKILEQLVGVCRVLEGFPAALESAYQERKNPPEASVVVPLRPENKREVSPR
jgi:cell division septum initiation protein DivIVA